MFLIVKELWKLELEFHERLEFCVGYICNGHFAPSAYYCIHLSFDVFIIVFIIVFICRLFWRMFEKRLLNLSPWVMLVERSYFDIQIYNYL